MSNYGSDGLRDERKFKWQLTLLWYNLINSSIYLLAVIPLLVFRFKLFYLLLQCLGWSWYLANDMQFYVISPILLYITFR